MYAAAAAAKSLQLCPTLHDPMDCSLPGCSVHGIFQARVFTYTHTHTHTHTHVYMGRNTNEMEKEMATHSIILAWRIPWTQEPGGLQSMGSRRVRHDRSD